MNTSRRDSLKKSAREEKRKNVKVGGTLNHGYREFAHAEVDEVKTTDPWTTLDERNGWSWMADVWNQGERTIYIFKQISKIIGKCLIKQTEKTKMSH